MVSVKDRNQNRAVEELLQTQQLYAQQRNPLRGTWGSKLQPPFKVRAFRQSVDYFRFARELPIRRARARPRSRTKARHCVILRLAK
jgi:hypothetical protein